MQIQAERADDDEDEAFGDDDIKKKELKKKVGNADGIQLNP